MGMKSHRLEVVVEKDSDGYFIYCPRLQGCYSQGDSYEEAIDNIRGAIKLHLKDRLASGEPIVFREQISITSLKVAL